MNNLIKNFTLASIVLLVFIVGCRKISDFDNVNLAPIEPEFAIPLITTSATISDLLANLDDDTFITILDDGLIKLNYKGDVIQRTSLDLFDVLSGGGFPVLDTVTQYYFDLPSSIDLDYAYLSGGSVNYLGFSHHEQDVALEMTFPQLIKDGEPFKIFRDINYIDTAPIPLFGSQSVEGYTLVSNNNDTISFVYEAIKEDGVRDTLSNLFITLSDFTFSYVQGYLGEDLYELPRDTIEIDFFKNWTQGNIYFEEPRILLTAQNSFGFPVRSKIELINIHTVTGDILPLESPYIEEGINIGFPSSSNPFEVVETPFDFNYTNSNIAEILGSGPVAVDYHINALPNPDSLTSIVGFATDSSIFRVQVEVELPFYGSANDFLAFDTISIDTFDLAADFSEVDNIKSAEFKLITENTLPLGVDLQVHFADQNGTIIDQLFENETEFIQGAPVDETGDVLPGGAELIHFINVDAARFEKLKEARFLFLQTAFSSTGQGEFPVKIKANQDVGIRMGVKFIYAN